MSYTVLARRYRSQTFDEVIGQEHVAQTLKKAIESDRIAHAFLFCGTRGTGKTSMARILAKALNCQKKDGPNPEPCGKCNSCAAVARGDDMSVIEIDAASNTGVDNIREVIENAYTRAPGRFKIYIIDEVHMLSKQAFNALLKTLEEPPAHVKFILATTEPEKVLPTILSRCQRYDFRNIPTREIAGHLKNILKDEKVKADDDALMLVARAGAGSMRDALSLLDRLLSVGEKNLTAEMIEQLLGMPRAQVIFDLAGAIASGDTRESIGIASKLLDHGLSSDALVAALIEHFRNLMILQTCGPESGLIEVPGLSMTDLQKQAQQFDAAALSQNIAILEELRRHLRSSAAGRALLDATLVRLALADQFTSVASMLDQSAPAPTTQKKTFEVDEQSAADEDDALPAVGKVWDGPSLKELLKSSPSFAEAKTQAADHPAPPSNVEPVDPSDLTAVMGRLRSAIHRTNPGIDGFLVRGKLVSIEDSVATICYPSDSAAAAQMLDRQGKREVIQDELSRLLGASVGIKLTVDATAPPPGEAVPQAKPRPMPASAPEAPPPGLIRITPELRDELKAKEPLIRMLIDELGAEIVKVE